MFLIASCLSPQAKHEQLHQNVNIFLKILKYFESQNLKIRG